MSGIEIVNGTVETHQEEMSDLLLEHFKEINADSYKEPRNPDWASYIELEKSGSLFSLFVKKEGELIGYSVNFITNHLHYSDLLVAHNDAIFIHKDHRKGGIGNSLIRMSEERAKYLGAKLYFIGAKQGSKLAAILPSIGYDIQDVTHLKVL